MRKTRLPVSRNEATWITPFGHKWAIATHKEDVSPEEMEKRMAAARP
jgi:hypothetical protein